MSAYQAGPSAMQRYNMTGMSSNYGDASARQLEGAMMNHAGQYAKPFEGPPNESAGGILTPGTGPNQSTMLRNEAAAYPVQYDIPTESDRDYRLKRQAAAALGAQVTMPMGQEEVAMLKEAEDKAELTRFDRYLSTMFDPRNPNDMATLNSIYPEFQERQISAQKQKYEDSIRHQMISMFGAHDIDDLRYLYELDQGYREAPGALTSVIDASQSYKAGWLSPWREALSKPSKDLRLPYSSAIAGQKPLTTNKAAWEIKDSNYQSGDAEGQGIFAQALQDKWDTSGDNKMARRVLSGRGAAHDVNGQTVQGALGPKPGTVYQGGI